MACFEKNNGLSAIIPFTGQKIAWRLFARLPVSATIERKTSCRGSGESTERARRGEVAEVSTGESRHMSAAEAAGMPPGEMLRHHFAPLRLIRWRRMSSARMRGPNFVTAAKTRPSRAPPSGLERLSYAPAGPQKKSSASESF